MSGEQDDVTIDDIELLIWRTLGIKDVGQVDNLLKAIQAYAEARVEKDRVIRLRGTGMTRNQAQELKQVLDDLADDPAFTHKVKVVDAEYDRLIGELEEKYPILQDTYKEGQVYAKDERYTPSDHPPYVKEDPDPAYARDGHPPFSEGEEFSKSKKTKDNSRDYEKVTDEDFAGMLKEVLSGSASDEVDGEPGEDMDELLRCARCERMKKRDRFAKDRSRKRGRRWKCRMCEAEVRIEKADARVKKN